MPTAVTQAAIIALGLLLGGCGHSEGGSTAGPPATGLPSAREVSAVPMGHIAGDTDSAALARSVPNPYAGNQQAVVDGRALYIKMNCAGCHAYNAKGNMGPDLTDTYWRYGGLPIEIYRSIHDGRAQGMPAWGNALPPTEIWKLVAYIQSLGGSFSVDGTARNPQRAQEVAPELPAHADAAASGDFAMPADAQPMPVRPLRAPPTPAARPTAAPPTAAPPTAAQPAQPPAAASSP